MAALGILLLLVLPGLSSGAVLCCDFDTATEGSTKLPCLCSGQSCVLDQATEDFAWKAHQGRTPTSEDRDWSTGPEDDHTRGDGSGLYIYTEVSGVNPDTLAVIRTPELSLSVTSCLTFWYHMKGLHMGDLEVLATYTDAVPSVIWERRGQQGDNWLFANTTLSPSVAQVTFRSTRRRNSDQPQGDMALDDIGIEEADCDSYTAPFPCRSTTSTGPSDPATTIGTFPIESTPTTTPATPTPPTTPTTPITPPTTPTTPITPPTSPTTPSTTPSIPSTAPPMSSISETTRDTLSTAVHCDFDTATVGSNLLPCECSGRSCVLEQVTTDHLNWTVERGLTPTGAGNGRVTGPDNDHTRDDGSGLYIYTEITNVNYGLVAEIQTPELSLSVTSCLTFWYHMKGEHIGDLQVLTADTGGTTSVIWERQGEQGDTWLSANTTLDPSVSRVSFRSIKRAEYGQAFGDIALDDIDIIEQPCDPDITEPPIAVTSTPELTTTTRAPSTTVTVTTTSSTSSTTSGIVTTTERQPSTAVPTTTRASTAEPQTTTLSPSLTSTATTEESTTGTTGIVENPQSPDKSRELQKKVAGSVVPVVVICIVVIVVVVLIWKRRIPVDCIGADKKKDPELGIPLSPSAASVADSDTKAPDPDLIPVPAFPVSPFTEPGPIPAGQLEKYVKKRKENLTELYAEYETLPDDDKELCTEANLSQNRQYLRFKDILPYDHTRVILDDEYDNGFINASYIKGYRGKEKAYIASQGPKPTTVTDLWRMVWITGANRIVMLANLEEDGKKRVAQYWPEDVGDTESYETHEVTLHSAMQIADSVVRVLLVKKVGEEETREILQFHFTTWTDKSRVRYGAHTLNNFLRLIHSHDRGKKGPLVVHCSAGVGRTGTLIALDILNRQLTNENQVQIYQTVQELRKQRMKLVQTPDQYVFLHDLLVENIKVGGRSYSAIDFPSKKRTLVKSASAAEFKLLTELKPVEDESQKSGRTAVNSTKNRDLQLIPDDNNRPYLSTHYSKGNDYINAVQVDGYHAHDWFVVTQMPLQNTIVDFWRLVYDRQLDTVVMLNELDIADKTYWPEEEQTTENYGPMLVELTRAEELQDDVICRDFVVCTKAHPEDESKLRVRQIQLLGWGEDSKKPPRISALPDLLEHINNWREQRASTTKASPPVVLVHCFNGRGASGLLCGVSFMLDKLKAENEVDAFLAARSVSRTRPQFFNSLEEYQYLYEVAAHQLGATSQESPQRHVRTAENEYGNVQTAENEYGNVEPMYGNVGAPEVTYGNTTVVDMNPQDNNNVKPKKGILKKPKSESTSSSSPADNPYGNV